MKCSSQPSFGSSSLELEGWQAADSAEVSAFRSYKKVPRFWVVVTAPTDVQISEVTATSVRLEWSYKGPEDLQYYVIQYKPKNANQAFSEISGIITMYYVVRALSPYTEYEFYLITVNNN
ncbi:GD24845 [Drosophila simulans]|uniref:GD24845 n=1 Tax=Drosophila simulans TaxID=7240 RepID=B4NUK2_DROSI|nr:GD24845 [Drosophila simulans]